MRSWDQVGGKLPSAWGVRTHGVVRRILSVQEGLLRVSIPWKLRERVFQQAIATSLSPLVGRAPLLLLVLDDPRFLSTRILAWS